MNVGIILAIFCVMLGISFAFYSDLVGLLSFTSLGISLALMESIDDEGLLVFISKQEMPSIKVISAWATLFIFIIMFSYKVFRDRQNYL